MTAIPPRHRWFRFSLRTLLMLIVVIAVPLAWIAKERRQSKYEAQVAEQLLRAGFQTVELRGPYDSFLGPGDPGWWQRLARLILGDRIAKIAGAATGNDDLTPLSMLTNLEVIQLDATRVSDLKPLAGHKKLRWLFIGNGPVRDISPLANLHSVERLGITGTLVSDLTPLTGLTNLKILHVYGENVTDEDVAALQKTLPNCEILTDPFYIYRR